MISSKSIVFYLLFAVGISLIMTTQNGFALEQTSTKFESHSVTGDELKNDPLAQKILNEIEESKKKIALLQKEQQQRQTELYQVESQREKATQLQQDAIALMDTQNEPYTPKAAFTSFVSTINDTATQNIFWGEFNYMSQKVDAGDTAMKQILEQGGSWDDAIKAFSDAAAMHHQDMIRENTELNVEYGKADLSIQSNFDTNGLLPVDYVKVPGKELRH